MLALLQCYPPHHGSSFTTTIKHTHTTILTAISSTTSISQLKQCHAQILRFNLTDSNTLIINLLLSSCSFSSLDYALSVFDQFSTLPPTFSNKFLRALSRSENPRYTLLAYEKLREEGLGVDRFSFSPLLKATGKVKWVDVGKEIHGLVVKMRLESDTFVQTGLVGMYAACGRISDARLVFDKMLLRDVVTWSIMIDGYCKSGLFDNVFQLFEEMKGSSIKPDKMLLSTIVSACGRAGNLTYGKEIHEFIAENNIVLDPHLQTALITMYINCGYMDTAQQLFDEMLPRNLVVSTAMLSGYSKSGQIEKARHIFDQTIYKDLICWSAMISGYAESERPIEALRLFEQMQVVKMKPDQITMLSVISACAHLGSVNHAKQIHLYVDKNGFDGCLPINNALIDMYAKCGCLDLARGVFDKMTQKNVISWTSMINAFAVHGDANNALQFFNKMKRENIQPNGVTFVGLLYACSHSGFVKEGKEVFASMVNDYNIVPKHEHYGCLVDLFGRANLLREALEVVESMPMAPNVVIWGSLMAACRVHGEIELGEYAAKQLLQLEPDHDGALVFLSNTYAKGKKWQDVGEVRKLMKRSGISKERGFSRTESNNKIHEFLTADRNHKEVDQIYEKLDEVVNELKLYGYNPNTSSVLVDLEEEEKKEAVLWHSEKLALCYALISGESGSIIRVVKNLRVCEDCHGFMKLVSKVYGREIVIRDRTRFHHYRDGVCSCNDFW